MIMKNFSQNNEQEVILNYFGPFKGAFLDIGANDGVTFSNTRALALSGWCGALVECSPRAFNKLRANYAELETKGCFYFHDFAIGDTNEQRVLNESGSLLGADDVGLVSTFDLSEMNRFKSVVSYEGTPVKMKRWANFINGSMIKTFHMLSIDVEGLEIPIMKQMDFTDFKLICVETNGSAEKKAILDEMLKEFKVIYTSAENLIYVR